MALSPYWRGFIRLSLVSVPVRAYTAFVTGGGEIHFNQLHAECHSRIQYKKTCPIHGEVSNDQIVSGFQYAKDQYVVVDPDELDKLRTEDEKAVNITAFVSPDTVDPIYLTGSTYYLVPDAPVGQRPYAVLRQAMIEENRYAVAQVVIHGKEHTVLLRPIGNVLAMSALSYEKQVTKPSAFDELAPSAQPSPEELDLTKTLIRASTAADFDFAAYKDVYTEKLTKVIEAKVAGEEIVAQPVKEEGHIINLMDALRASVAKVHEKGTEAGKPAKKMAPSKGKEPAARKRKSS
jgi:DNA end-binding protein Ku